MKRTIILSVIALVAAVPRVCFGDLTGPTTDYNFEPVGVPVEENSWKQWWAGLPAETDLIGHKIASAGHTFESPGYSSFTQLGWDMVVDSPTLVSASGPPVTTIGFYVHFPGNSGDYTPADPLIVDGVLFRGDTLIYTTRNIWSGSSWSYQPNAGYWTPTRAQVVPAPAAVLLGIIGMGVAGWKLRKFA